MKNAVSNSQGLLSPLFAVSDTRIDLWPDVKSSKDLGLNLQELYPIAGAARLICAPKGIPDDVKTIMAESLEKATKNPQFKTDMEKAGYYASSGDATVAAMTVQTILEVLQKNKDLLK
jgi:tripartite-type tricarboxylate transporter receptor subunit TctC